MRNDPARKLPKSVALVEDLVRKGVDVSQLHAVSHFFVGAAAQATAVAESFGELGYTVKQPLGSQGDGDFSVVLDQPIDGQTITDSIIAGCRIAEAQGLGYDGWDVDVSRWKLSGSKAG